MSYCHYENFDIVIQGDHAPYHVHVTYRAWTANGLFRADALQSVWQDHIRMLDPTGRPPGEQMIGAIGGQLFDELMQEEIRDLWVSARVNLEEEMIDGLRVRLMLQSPAVASLPWECLNDRRRQHMVALHQRTTLVRVDNLFSYVGPSRPLATELPIRILLAAPEDPTPVIDADEEVQAIRNALAPLGSDVQLRIEAGRMSVLDLRRALDAQQPDVLHIVSHGQPDGILFWQDDTPVYASPGSLQSLLEQARSVKLVFLNACLAGQPSNRAPMAAAGQRLLQAGVPAVIAMQFEIPDQIAVRFAGYLYQALVNGRCPGAVDVAMGDARSSLYMIDAQRFDFGTPVLWLNAGDGDIFHLRDTAGDNAAAPFQGPPDPEPAFVPLALDELLEWLASRPDWAPEQLPALLRPVSLQRRNLLTEAAWHLQRLSRLAESRAAGQENNGRIADELAELQELRNEIERLERFLQGSTA